jgi:hypothetical protein
MKTQSTTDALSVPLHRFVRLVAPLAGQYCKLEAGEVVMIVPMCEERGETIWRIARKAWINSLTISNVLAGVPDHKLIVEEPNDQAVAEGRAADDRKH